MFILLFDKLFAFRLKTQSPRGDGNRSRHTHILDLFEIENTIPERGRKLRVGHANSTPGNSIENTIPERGRKLIVMMINVSFSSD